MNDTNERSAYPHPDEFKVMRPEYADLDDGMFQATILIAPFKVSGRSATKPGARRAAIYEAAKTYRSYHPSFSVEMPFPESFEDKEGMKWKRVPLQQRESLGDYMFTDPEGEEDFADLETMLMWDVRPKQDEDDEE